MKQTNFRMIAKTLQSLEPVLADELRELGAQHVEEGRRMVSFEGDKAMLYRANLRLRTALRILKPVFTFRAKDADELYGKLRDFDWSSVMSARQTFAIDTTVYSEVFSHSKYVGYKAKDAIVDYWRDKTGERPSVQLTNPDIYLNIHIAHDEVTLSLDSSGESLHKRGYRQAQTEAPINEVLAAGIILMSGWRGESDLIDPMCGSGTFLIEAALIALNIAPGIYRSGFAFERWEDFDSELFHELYNDDSQERAFAHHIYGSDILADAIRISQLNVDRAGLGQYISLQVVPFEDREAPEAPAFVVMNPPYGERLKLSRAETLYGMIGERLKHQYAGSKASIIAYKPEHFNSIGLRQSKRIELANGSLECELREYELFAGSRDEYKRASASAPKSSDRGLKEAKPSRGSKSQRGERPEARPRREDRRRGQEEGRPFASKPERERSGGGSALRGDRKVRTPNDGDKRAGRRMEKPRQERSSAKKGLWPTDRFRYADEEGRERRRPYKRQTFQLFRDGDDN